MWRRRKALRDHFQDMVLTEEQPPITVKWFLNPINTYKIVGAYDELVKSGRIVLQEREGLRVLADLRRFALERGPVATQ
jgi:hypothetical protein